MADSLEKKLRNIENALGGDALPPEHTNDRLGWHLDYIESLIDDGGDVQLKTINDESLKGEGNISLEPSLPSKTGHAGQFLKVNSNADGFEYGNAGGGGGGASLYEHKLLFNVLNDADESAWVTGKFISWIDTAFTHIDWRDLNGLYLSAFISSGYCEHDNPTYETLTPVITITNEQDEVKIMYIDPFGNFDEYLPDWDTGEGGWVVSDTVTPLN